LKHPPPPNKIPGYPTGPIQQDMNVSRPCFRHKTNDNSLLRGISQFINPENTFTDRAFSEVNVHLNAGWLNMKRPSRYIDWCYPEDFRDYPQF